MKLTIDKCETCGKLFEDHDEYRTHVTAHENLADLAKAFPAITEVGCHFANGEYCVQRDADWFMRYKKAVESLVSEPEYTPWTYGWFRSLDDGSSMYYSVACRTLCVCQKCYREWGQPYYANHCDHTQKGVQDAT